MRLKWLKILMLAIAIGFCVPVVHAQKIIEYVSGMGTRDPNNPDIWILYNKVRAKHEGMTLYTDSASLDTRNNIFVAHRNVKIILTDTTTLYGKTAVYDGTTRVAQVWGDTVRLIDGGTVLKTDELSYERNTSTAYYYRWGHTTHGTSSLDSRRGYYHTDTRDLFLYDNVVLCDSNSRLETDTLHYNTRTSLAVFVSPTHIYSDSSTVYSENGSYNTDSHIARSYKASKVANREKYLSADTIFFNDKKEHGEAYGHVIIVDTLNDVTCTGHVGIADQQQHFSFVTDSALIVYVDEGDSVFMHADTIWAFSNEDKEFNAATAYRNVKLYRKDVQCISDSIYYSAPDSLVTLYYSPVVWHEDYQCTADTIRCHFDSDGIDIIYLNGNVFAAEEVDTTRYNQVKGRNAVVHCKDSEPLYADIIGSARMVYYVMDDDDRNNRQLIGVNVGIGSDIRIYFKDRKPTRVVTYGQPDMKMYPPLEVPADERLIQGFEWRGSQRPRNRYEVFPIVKPHALGDDNVTN